MHFVAFMDVLGFKEMVDHCTHEKLQRVYKNAFVSNATFGISNGKFQEVSNGAERFIVPDLREPLTSCLVVSDSVILWTKDASTRSFVNIVAAARNILNSGFFNGLPMRGGIELGELSYLAHTADANGQVSIQSVFGKALTNAYKIESKQQWAGCAISQRCIDHYEQDTKRDAAAGIDIADIDYLVSKKILMKYSVPLKDNNSEEMWVVNWVSVNNTAPEAKTISDAFSMHNKSSDDLTTQQKIENTLRFLQHAGAA